jgi:hypothetical protein
MQRGAITSLVAPLCKCGMTDVGPAPFLGNQQPGINAGLRKASWLDNITHPSKRDDATQAVFRFRVKIASLFSVLLITCMPR